MHTLLTSLAQMDVHGSYLAQYFKKRHEEFVEKRGWNIPHADGLDFDQYDVPQSRYAMVVENGTFLAGIRLMPTTAEHFQSTYMIKDAADGKLENIPCMLMKNPPVDSNTWELTRLIVEPTLQGEKRLLTRILLSKAILEAQHRYGIKRYISIFAKTPERLATACGLKLTPIGPELSYDGKPHFVTDVAPLPDVIHHLLERAQHHTPTAPRATTEDINA